MKKAFSFLNGFFSGAVLAGLVVLLFTPDSGEGIRTSFMEIIERTKNEINLASQEKRMELESELSKLRQR
jgi:gas vesicle protein